MIKKNTKLIFEGTRKVVEKIVDCKYDGEDLVSDITYNLRRK